MIKTTWRRRGRKAKQPFKYDVFCSGVENKVEKKVSIEAFDLDEATEKARRFALVAGLKLSHVKAQEVYER